MSDDRVWARLVEARDECGRAVADAYDEVLNEVAERVRACGSVGKADIGALVLWKRMRADTRWAMRLSSMRDADVRAISATAVTAVCDQRASVVEAARRGRRSLSSLPGFANGDALASAILVAAAPDRMAVYDRRARTGLTRLGYPLPSSPGRYGRYMELIEHLRALGRDQSDDTWTAHDIDLALYLIGGPNAPT